MDGPLDGAGNVNPCNSRFGPGGDDSRVDIGMVNSGTMHLRCGRGQTLALDADLQFVAGGPTFTEYGAPVAKNAGLGRIGIGWQQGNIAVDADYEGLAGNGVKDQAAKVSVSIRF